MWAYILGALALAVAVTGYWVTKPYKNPYYDPAKIHHKIDGFTNADGIKNTKTYAELRRWRSERAGKPPQPSTLFKGYNFPVLKPDVDYLNHNKADNTVTFIGHSTLLVQMSGLNILTDPQFSHRASPVFFAGPERRTGLPLAVKELPKIDLVVISHSHYDHLDDASVREINAANNGQTRFLVPLGLKAWMQKRGITNVEEYDWWEGEKLGAAEITFVPARHWSARGLFDRNHTLWGGWVVKSPQFSFYFAGDTGYGEGFKEIGDKLGPFDVAAIPIGAYEPRWFMKNQHTNPEEALEIFKEVKGKNGIGIHFGTFELTDEALDIPLVDLEKAKTDKPELAGFIALKHGETRKYGGE
jgi:L-ascorbate metabolism protein UlaG (beta-lactamase superfamily)